MGILVAALILGVVIIVHEFGHFLMAKASGIVVEEFSVGMGPRLLSKQIGGTRYSLKLVPFGGSCMMKGEDADDVSEGTFNSKPVWKRIAVIAGGPVFNFILAFVGALIIISCVGYDSPEILVVNENTPEAEAGLEAGDVVTKFNGKSVNFGRELYSTITLDGIPEDEVKMTVLREGEKKEITYHPEKTKRYMLGFTYMPTEQQPVLESVSPEGALAQAGLEAGDYIYKINGVEMKSGTDMEKYLAENPLDGTKLAISYLRDGLEYDVEVTPEEKEYVDQGFAYNMMREKTSFLNTLKYSVLEVKYWIVSTLDGFKMLFTGKVGMESMAGPVGVVDMMGDVYEESKGEGALMMWMTMLNMMILISANLGVLNLVPFPALDGGRLVFLLIEAIFRKPVNRNVEGVIHFAGLVILLGFILLITMRDIGRLF